MFYLVDKETNKILVTSPTEEIYGKGEAAEKQKAGTAVWMESALAPDEVKVSASGKVVVDPAKKAEKDKILADQQARLAILKEVKKAKTLEDLQAVLVAVVEELFGEVGR